MSENSRKSLILFCQGGAGDVMAHTPMIRAARKKYPNDEIIVAATYAKLLEGNPNIDVLVHLNDDKEVQDFYVKYVEKRDLRFYKKFFVYDHWKNEAMVGCRCLPEFIASLYNMKDFYDDPKPDFFPTNYEREAIDAWITRDPRPIVLLHIYSATPSENGIQKMLCGVCGGRGVIPSGICPNCNGAGSLIVNRHKTTSLKDVDPNKIAELIKAHEKTTFDGQPMRWIQIGLEGEPQIPGTESQLGMDFRDTCTLIGHPQVKSFIFIESIFAHIAASYAKKGVVIFQNVSSSFFGYNTAVNFQDMNGCSVGPCNRGITGALMDFEAGYSDPKSKARDLRQCRTWECSKFDVARLNDAFVSTLRAAEKPKVQERVELSPLEKARRTPPPPAPVQPEVIPNNVVNADFTKVEDK